MKFKVLTICLIIIFFISITMFLIIFKNYYLMNKFYFLSRYLLKISIATPLILLGIFIYNIYICMKELNK
jgi:hypothetical protein